MIQHSALIGRAGEYRVISELLIRGYNPSITIIDNGYDTILDNGITIQIKTVFSKNKNGYWSVPFGNPSYRLGKKREVKTNLKANFVIIWIVKEDCFYIIPKNAIGSTLCIALGGKKSKWIGYKNNWTLLK